MVAIGENRDLAKGWGRSWEPGMRPTAYTNPIYVDLDSKGFQPNAARWDTQSCRQALRERPGMTPPQRLVLARV
jgi:hypothetical protein